MKFSIKRAELLKALRRTQGIVGKKESMPILSSILIAATKTGLTVTATDLEISIRGDYEAVVEEMGAAAVPAKKFYDIARELPGEDAVIKLGASKLSISSGQSKYKLLTLAAEEYPQIPEAPTTELITLDANLFGSMLDRTIFAAGDNDARYILNGLMMNIQATSKGIGIAMVGTDGHRLAMVSRTAMGSCKDAQVVIPKRALLEIRRILDEDASADLQFGFTTNQVVFKKPNLIVMSKLIDGNYPNYKQVIPVGSPNIAAISRKDMIGALKRVSLLTSEKSRAVKLQFDSGKLQLSAVNVDQGEATEDMSISYTGPAVTIGFNYNYLNDVLSCIENDQVAFAMNDGLSPAVITAAGDAGHTCVVMPLRV